MKQKIIIICFVSAAFLTGLFVFSSQQYDFKTLDEKKVKLSELEGDFVVINFFAEWCAPCLKEIPELNAFNESKPDNTHLFAISYDNLTEEALGALKHKYNMQFDLVSFIKTQLPFDKPAYLPATYIITPDGEVQGPLLGEVTNETLANVIRDLAGA
ncbi:MAG: TlpA disulfide reductase family protein [Pseudomonadota bacterium]